MKIKNLLPLPGLAVVIRENGLEDIAKIQ